MAITVVQLADEGNVSLGPIVTSVVDITLDSSYPTNGYTAALGLTAANLNCGRGINGMSWIGNNTAAAGYVPQYNTQTGNLQILVSAAAGSPLEEVPGNPNLATLTFRFKVVGQR